MKKILFLVSITMANFGAIAQSTVTLYGRVNTTVESQKIGTDSRVTLMANNASRFGFKGTEDLGAGLKASFILESGFHSDDGKANDPMWGREASVQLSSPLGAVKMGRWAPESYGATADYISMHNHDTGSSSDALYAFGTAFPIQNKLGYYTPDLGGFTGQVVVALGEGKESNILEVSGNYVYHDSLHLGGGFSKQDKANQFAGRALYFMGPVAVGGYLQRENVEGSAFGESRNIYRLVGMYTVGASEFHANFGGTQKGGTQAEKAKQYTLGYNYNLSKRTKVYGYYTAIDSQSKARSFNSVAIGVRHNF